MKTNGNHRVTFLTFDSTEDNFALHDAAIEAVTVIGALTAKSLFEASPSAAPVSIPFWGIISDLIDFLTGRDCGTFCSP